MSEARGLFHWVIMEFWAECLINLVIWRLSYHSRAALWATWLKRAPQCGNVAVSDADAGGE